MKIDLGFNYFDLRKGVRSPVAFDTSRLINGHVLLVGASGTGKSYTLRRMMAQAGGAVRFHVFDVHGDLDIEGASVVQFSEHAPYGLNPLRVNPDPHFGGVRKAVQGFIRTVNQASVTALGVKQESVLRNLLYDVFHEFGFHEDDPATWSMNAYDERLVSGGRDNRLYLDVPITEKDEAKTYGARWDPEKRLWWIHTHKYQGGITKWPPKVKERSYPTVADIAAYARRIHRERFLGSDQKAIQELEHLHRKARVLQRRMLEAAKRQHQEIGDIEEDEKLDDARQKAIMAYEAYVNAIRTGFEMENLLKYDSSDVLKSVVDRLDNLKATGIFKAASAPFNNGSPVWRYKLNALSQEEKKMFVLFRMQELFAQALQRGEQDDVVEVIVLDELGVYTSSQDNDGGDGIIGTVSREARKFGLALWAANQSPANIPESLISSVATKVILGIDEMYWQPAVSKLRIERRQLEWIQAHRTLAVQMKEKGALKNRWWWVSLQPDSR